MARRTLLLFVALAFLHLAPIWSVRYLPLGDGPTHIYNAWVLHGLITGEAPAHIENAYKVDWRPHPNWSGHALMAVAIAFVPPLIAEKLLLTLILALMLAGTWLLATSVDPRNGVYAFLAFPFTWTQTLVAGYYNYSLSIGLYLFIIAIWWRRRERASIGSIALLATLLVLCNFTHPMAAGLACGSIVLLSLLTRRFGHLPAIIPVIPLLAMFGSTAESNTGAPPQLHITWDAARILAKIDTLYAFDDRIRPVAIVLALLYLGLIIFTLTRERRREADAIAILALTLIAMMFWIPAAQGTRELFTGRMQQFVFLILPAWFTSRIADRWRTALLALLSLLAIANAAIAFERIRHFGREMETLVRTFDPIERGTTLLPLFFERPHSHSFVNVFAHFMSYVALDKQLLDHSNYEPSTNYFPITYRAPALGSHVIDTAPGSIDLKQPVAYADYVVTHHFPDDTPNRATLRTLYRLIKDSGDFQLYRRHSSLIGPYELVLLPLLGTPGNTRWVIDQTLHNRDSRPMRIVFRNCPHDLWCDRELAPGEAVRIATTQQRFAFLDVPKGRDHLLGITTIARRVDIDRPETSITTPAAHQRDFSRGGAQIRSIDTRGGMKLGLRVYVFGDRATHEITLRVRSSSDGTPVAERRFSVDNFGMYEDGELRAHTAGVTLPPFIDVELSAGPDANVWAFATMTDERDRTIVLRSRPHAARGGDSSAGDRRDPDRGDVHDVLGDRR
jgi:hypothetical protein